MRCHLKRAVDDHFAGTLPASEERVLRLHLPFCAVCTPYYRHHLLLARLDPSALSATERLLRGLGWGGRVTALRASSPGSRQEPAT